MQAGSRGRGCLYDVARDGDEEAVRQIVTGQARAWVQPDAPREDGATPLHVAASHGHVGIVRLLLQAEPADVNTRRDSSGRTALHTAAAHGRAAAAHALIAAGADVNLARDNGSTPLHAAAAHGHAEVVRLLLGAGAVVNLGRDDNGKTALHVAVGQGRLDIVEMLLVRRRSDCPSPHGSARPCLTVFPLNTSGTQTPPPTKTRRPFTPGQHRAPPDSSLPRGTY